MQYLVLGNPLWSGQLALLGGWRRMFWTLAVYALLLVVACAVALKWAEFRTEREAAIWVLKYLPYIQILVLYAGGLPTRAKAMIRDHTTLMIESIRISPMSAYAVVGGYMFGPVIGTLLSWMIGVVVGWVLITAYNIGGGGDWLAGNGVLLIAVMTAWALQVFLGVGSKKPNGAIIVAYFAFFFLGRVNEALVCAPGTSLFLGLHPAILSLGVMRGVYPAQYSLAIGLFASVVMTLFWFWAAVRRFRRPEASALSPRGAVILCALWALCAGGTYLNLDVLHAGSAIVSQKTRPLMGMLMSTLAMIFAGIPIAASTLTTRVEILQSQNPTGKLKSRSWPSAIAGLLIALTLMWVTTHGNVQSDLTFTSVALVLIASTVTCFGAFRRSAIRLGTTVPAWSHLAAYWVLPAIVAAVWLSIELARTTGNKDAHIGLLFFFSPLGALISTWWFPDSYFDIGIVVQFSLAILVLMVGYWVERSFRREREDRIELKSIELAEAPPPAADAYSVPSNNGDDT